MYVLTKILGPPLKPNIRNLTYLGLPLFCQNHQKEASGNANDTVHQIPDQRNS